jgi:hypothetical protein
MQDINYYKQYVGQSVYGFWFDKSEYKNIGFAGSMRDFIGKKGVITRVRQGRACIVCDVNFTPNNVGERHVTEWAYPIEEAVKHLHKPDL